jgi:Mn2+/Fe2+ NRAMP family transporter
MAEPLDEQREAEWLGAVAALPFPKRCGQFVRRGGPAYLQSALTLGGGTASSAVVAGCTFGYELLWVAPVGIVLGAVMLAALAHQTLSTGLPPLVAMRQHAGRGFAFAWAAGALLASVIWHFPQYSLGSAVLADAGAALGADLPRGPLGVAILFWSVLTAQAYGSRSVMVRLVERGATLLVWAIVLCFVAVVVATGVRDWGALAKGFFAFSVPPARGDTSGLAVALSGIAAAVVVNMTFVYPHTLRARGWSREHRQRARYDLAFGLCLPYVFAVSAIVIATANTVHASGHFAGTKLSPVQAAQSLAGVLGPTGGRLLFDAGILGMVLTTVTMHMVCCGLVCSEWFGWSRGSWRYRVALLLPAPGVLGAWWWQELSLWVAVPTSVLVGFLLPVIYVAILKLQCSQAYLGADRLRGLHGTLWLSAMGVAVLVVSGFLVYYVVTDGWRFVTRGPG